MMTQLTLIVPFSVPPGPGGDGADEAVADALLRQLELPALGKLLTRAAPGPRERHDDPWLRTLPQERWLAARAGLPTDRVPTAPYMRLADLRQSDAAATAAPGTPNTSLPSPSGRGAGGEGDAWACLQPVHIHAARDHLVLVHPDQLDLRADEATALRAAIDELLAESGITLEIPTPARWYLPEATFGPLEATTPLRAAGRNIDIWLQAGARARDWRRLQNEIQMTWHDHPVNEAREAAGRIPVNSVWLHGGGAMQAVPRLADTVLANDAFLTGLALAGGSRAATLPARFADVGPTDGSVMALLEHASESYLAADWHQWLMHMHALDTDWFAPALEALGDGSLQALTLVLSGENHFAEFTVRRADLRKFWRGLGTRGNWRTLLSDLAMAA